jgi:superfamily I DNA and/or RNA helicase
MLPSCSIIKSYSDLSIFVKNLDIEISDEAILRSALDYTHRLPHEIRELIARLYRKDNIELQGKPRDENIKQDEITGTWEKLLQGNGGLYLVVHDERESKRSNQIELKIIKNILDAGGKIPDGSTAIITPHRAQRSLLKTQLANYYGKAVDVIDTVEKVQGGERDNVIVSATASNPSAIGKNVEFILSLNRSNVAFSRVKKRLIVVCSKTLLDYIPKEIEHYEEATLWKALRSECTDTLFNDNIDKHQVQVLTRSLKSRTKEGD